MARYVQVRHSNPVSTSLLQCAHIAATRCVHRLAFEHHGTDQCSVRVIDMDRALFSPTLAAKGDLAGADMIRIFTYDVLLAFRKSHTGKQVCVQVMFKARSSRHHLVHPSDISSGTSLLFAPPLLLLWSR